MEPAAAGAPTKSDSRQGTDNRGKKNHPVGRTGDRSQASPGQQTGHGQQVAPRRGTDDRPVGDRHKDHVAGEQFLLFTGCQRHRQTATTSNAEARPASSARTCTAHIATTRIVTHQAGPVALGLTDTRPDLHERAYRAGAGLAPGSAAGASDVAMARTVVGGTSPTAVIM